MHPPILVVAAVRQELAAFEPAAGRVLCRLTGMGPRAGKTVAGLLAREPYRMVISAGFAGATQPGYGVGDLVAASEVIDVSSGRRTPAGPIGPRLSGLARQGRFITVDRVLSGPSKVEMGRRFGGIAVDMETASVAAAADRAGVPWVGLRAILDPVEVSIPVVSALAAAGGGRTTGLDLVAAAATLVQPWRWGEWVDLIRSVRKAKESLGAGLQFLVEEFLSSN